MKISKLNGYQENRKLMSRETISLFQTQIKTSNRINKQSDLYIKLEKNLLNFSPVNFHVFFSSSKKEKSLLEAVAKGDIKKVKKLLADENINININVQDTERHYERINLDEYFGVNTPMAAFKVETPKDPVEKIRFFFGYTLPSGKLLGEALANTGSCPLSDKVVMKEIKESLFKDFKEFRKLQLQIHPDSHPDIKDASQLTAFLNNLKALK